VKVGIGAPSILTYDDEDRLKTFMGQTYTYNGFDTRVGKTVGGSTTSYHRDGSGVTAPLISDSGATYTPGISERRNGVSTFLNSGLKDIAKQTDAAGVVTATRKYDAYGMAIGSTGAWKGPFGYSGSAGYQEDETGLQLLGHRYYDSSTGRFITRDPVKSGSNWYVYCDNNPVVAIDATGLFLVPANAAHDGLVWSGAVSLHAGLVRGGYIAEKAQLPKLPRGQHDPARDLIRDKWQKLTPEPYRSMLPNRPGGQTGGNTKGNPAWNKAGAAAKGVGKACLAVAVAMDVCEFALADDKAGAAAGIAGGWAGALAGGYLGAKTGALLGGCFGPGGAVVGALLFGIAGSMLGGYAGRAAAGGLYYG
jgi:RHS repeat-associated protein